MKKANESNGLEEMRNEMTKKLPMDERKKVVK